jgi:prephenate dehydrogenase
MRNVALVGTGLIGTSIAMALRRRGVTIHLIDRDLMTAAAAAERCGGTVGVPAEPADLAVLAVPPAQVASVLRAHQRRNLARCYTDVASVKSAICEAVRSAGCEPDTFVGGHPLAGGERPGPRAARPDLFEGRPWVLTPDSRTGSAAIAAALELVELCGARPVVMGCAEHDEALAASSHAPHVVASALAASFSAAPPEVVELCGRGIGDTTRIAAGDVGLWTEILTMNGTAVANALAPIVQELVVATAILRVVGDRPAEAAALADLLARGRDGCGNIRSAEAKMRPVATLDATSQPVLSAASRASTGHVDR